jgi:O-antigen chain-terminating methyltransferase
MVDLDTLVERLRAVAAQHGSSLVAETVEVRPWPPTAEAGIRDTLLDALTLNQAPRPAQFLGIDADDFIDLAFRTCLGRAADPAGRAHYQRALQQGVPRLETLAQLAASPEGVTYGGAPRWPLWLRPFMWGLRMPVPGARRASRAVLRRLERQLGRQTRHTPMQLLWRLAEAIDDRDRARRRDAEAISRDLAATTERLSRAESLASATRSDADDLATRLSALGADFGASSKALAAVRARLALLDYAGKAPADARSPTLSPAPDEDIAGYYLTLESVFRGDPSRIRAQLETDYLALLIAARDEAGDGPCVDLGCGRGEWLDVLVAHGLVAHGVDSNAMMAAAARERGHDVTAGDALAYMRTLPDDSMLAISAFHLAEHLPFPILFHLIAECRRALKARGLLVLETPNPENIWVATHTFHHDPTHGAPLTPDSLEFLVNHHGLETVAILRLHPYPKEARLAGNDPVSERLNGMTCCGQDFAVVAKKTPLAP